MNDYFQKKVHSSWYRVFSDNFLKQEYSKIISQLQKEYFFTDTIDFMNYSSNKDNSQKSKLYPIFSDILRCFRCSNFESIKLIIIGSSPPQINSYIGIPWHLDTLLDYGTILSKEDDNFEVVADNLRENNLMKRIRINPMNLIQKGIFFLYSALTVDSNKYHFDLWREFMIRLICSIQDVNKNIVFIALGEDASILMKSSIIDQTNVFYDVKANMFTSNYGKLLKSDVFKKAFDLVENYTNEKLII